MNVFLNFCKSTVLATLIFWMIISPKSFEVDTFLFVLLSMIPVFVCCVVTIALTIYPFFRLFETETFDKKAVFNTFFPFYAIVAFSLCIYVIFLSDLEFYMIAFFTSAFMTTSYSWVWFSKEPM